MLVTTSQFAMEISGIQPGLNVREYVRSAMQELTSPELLLHDVVVVIDIANPPVAAALAFAYSDNSRYPTVSMVKVMSPYDSQPVPVWSRADPNILQQVDYNMYGTHRPKGRLIDLSRTTATQEGYVRVKDYDPVVAAAVAVQGHCKANWTAIGVLVPGLHGLCKHVVVACTPESKYQVGDLLPEVQEVSSCS